MQVQRSSNSTNGWISLTHVLKLTATEARTEITFLARIEPTTSAVLIVGVRGYLLLIDYSGDILIEYIDYIMPGKVLLSKLFRELICITPLYRVMLC